MTEKTVVTRRVNYFLTTKESEKIYSKLHHMGYSPTRYAESVNVHKSTFTRILTGTFPMTEQMYLKAFKKLDCITEIPEKWKSL